MKNIILISGKRTCGKDTAALFIQQHLISKGKTTDITGFGRALKLSFCKNQSHLISNQSHLTSSQGHLTSSRSEPCDFARLMNDYVYKEQYREALTEYFINMKNIKGEDYFVNEVIKYIDNSDYNNYIVSDLRFMYEVKAFRSLNPTLYKVIMVRVNSTIESRMKRGWIEKSCDSDFLEIGLDNCMDFNIIVDNDNTIDDLKQRLLVLIDDILIDKKIE